MGADFLVTEELVDVSVAATGDGHVICVRWRMAAGSLGLREAWIRASVKQKRLQFRDLLGVDDLGDEDRVIAG